MTANRLLLYGLFLSFFLIISLSAAAQVHVRGYYRKDGTYVQPHYRSRPDGNFDNNWSTKGNVNPYTGKEGTRVSPPSSGYSGTSLNQPQPFSRAPIEVAPSTKVEIPNLPNSISTIPKTSRIPDLSDIYQAQVMLSVLGYGVGPIDGICGRLTEEAIRAFQRDHGLAQSGLIEQSLLELLRQSTVLRGQAEVPTRTPTPMSSGTATDKNRPSTSSSRYTVNLGTGESLLADDIYFDGVQYVVNIGGLRYFYTKDAVSSVDVGALTRPTTSGTVADTNKPSMSSSKYSVTLITGESLLVDDIYFDGVKYVVNIGGKRLFYAKDAVSSVDVGTRTRPTISGTVADTTKPSTSSSGYSVTFATGETLLVDDIYFDDIQYVVNIGGKRYFYSRDAVSSVDVGTLTRPKTFRASEHGPSKRRISKGRPVSTVSKGSK